ncbi:UbiH/UbiF/VisC/COQ6 family ubiquinone biosynthesis hydroxylase [Pseudomonas sp. HK3]
MNQQFDVIIIGGGLVGAALACALKDAPISIALVEAQAAPSLNLNALSLDDADLRVSALNRASELFLTRLGVWQALPQKRLSAYDKMRVWDGEGTGHIQFTANELAETHLGHIVENSVTNVALMAALSQQTNVQVFNPAKVESIESLSAEQTGYLLQLDSGQLLQSSMVVAADGARSWVREWAQFDMREWDYEHHALVCTVEVDTPHDACAWQRFTEDGVLAFLPLAQPNLCSIVWSCTQRHAQQLLELSDTEFLAQLTRAFEGTLGDVKACGKRVAIPLRQRHAKQYVKNGIVLVGDAAHSIHPLAGQGVNLGFMDAYVLADEIKQGIARGLSASHPQVLARFERRRMPENLSMMATMEAFKRFFAIKTPAIRWLRNWGMSKLNRVDFIKNHIVQQAMGSKREIR